MGSFIIIPRNSPKKLNPNIFNPFFRPLNTFVKQLIYLSNMAQLVCETIKSSYSRTKISLSARRCGDLY